MAAPPRLPRVRRFIGHEEVIAKNVREFTDRIATIGFHTSSRFGQHINHKVETLQLCRPGHKLSG